MSSGSTGDQPHGLLGDPLPADAPSIPLSMSTGSAGLGVWASPLAIDEDSGEKFGFQKKKTSERFKRALNYYVHHFIGPMPVDEFLDTFMNRQVVLKRRDLDPMPPPEDAFAGVPEKAESEADIYAPLIKSLNSYVDPNTKKSRSRCPGFRFLDTSARSDTTHGSLGGVKPDVCCYADPHVELVKGTLTEKAKSEDRGPTIMGFAALFIEVKRHPSFDPFKDPPSGKDRSYWRFLLNLEGVGAGKQEQVRECFGQNTTYAAEILARQHRQFLYSISLCGSVARIIRWDRAGAVCTNAFDIRESPQHLCEFIWCFAAASDMERGYDLNVEMAHPHENILFRNAIEYHLICQAPVKPVTPKEIGAVWEQLPIHFLAEHVTAIRLPLHNSNAVQRFLVSRPFIYPLAAFGSGTRTYWAVDVSAPHCILPPVVLLKDTWREDVDPPSRKPKEGEVVQNLTRLCVDNVPKVRSYEDVIQRDKVVTRYPDKKFHMAIQDLGCYQSTLTQDFLDAPWVCGAGLPDHLVHVRIRKHTHHRLVYDAAGHTLVQVCGTHELLAATLDVLDTLNSASKAAGVVHRALSPMSIILYRPVHMPNSHRMGYLIDWDQSWDENEDMSENEPFSPPWQFVCSDLALSITRMRRYTMVHDMEALLYVVLYLAILYLPPTPESKKAEAPASAIKLFEGQHVDGGQPNSNAKQLNKTDGRFTGHLGWENPQMKLWMDRMLAALQPPPDPTDASQWTYTNVKTLWEKILEDTPFEEDRMNSLVPLNGREVDAPRTVKAEPNCPTMSNPGSLGAKEDLDSLYRGTDPIGTSFVNRMNTGLALETRGRAVETHAGGLSTTVIPTLYIDTGRSLAESSKRRDVPRAATNAEAGPSRLPAAGTSLTSSNDAHDAPDDRSLDASTSSGTKSRGGGRKRIRRRK